MKVAAVLILLVLLVSWMQERDATGYDIQVIGGTNE